MSNDPQHPDQEATRKAAAETQSGQLSTGGAIPDQADPQASGNPEVTRPRATQSTQSNMGDGAGIRGDYGDASQTNGLEGGPESAPDGSPAAEK